MEGAVAGCGIGGRVVDRISLLGPACPSGALAVVPAIRKPGKEVRLIYPQRSGEIGLANSFSSSIVLGVSLLLSMGAVVEF